MVSTNPTLLNLDPGTVVELLPEACGRCGVLLETFPGPPRQYCADPNTTTPMQLKDGAGGDSASPSVSTQLSPDSEVQTTSGTTQESAKFMLLGPRCLACGKTEEGAPSPKRRQLAYLTASWLDRTFDVAVFCHNQQDAEYAGGDADVQQTESHTRILKKRIPRHRVRLLPQSADVLEKIVAMETEPFTTQNNTVR